MSGSQQTDLRLTVRYTCAGRCECIGREVSVLARTDPDLQGSVEWVEYVRSMVEADHEQFDCAGETFALWIPSPEDSPWVGAPLLDS